MANPSLQIGNSNWAIKKDNLLGYSTAGTRFLPIPITMTRASAGTRVNPQGLVETVELLGSEEITNGDFATDSDWTKGTGWTISGGKANCDGSQSGNAGLIQSSVFTSGKTYKLSFNITSNGSTFKFWVNGTQNIFATSLVDGLIEYTFIASATGSAYFEATSTFIGSIDNVSVKESTKNDLARVDYTGSTSSLLAEPQRTNLVLNSEPTTNEGAAANVTYESFAWAIGFNNCVAFGNNSAIRYRYGGSVTSGTEYTLSAYILMDDNSEPVVSNSSSSGDFSLNIGNAVGGGTINASVSMGNNIWRVSVTRVTTQTTSNNGIIKYTTQSSKGFKVVGFQLEEGSYATSYIPTSGSTVTRVQDQYSKTGISDKINSEEGVLFAEISALSDDETNREITLSDGSSNNYVLIRFNSGGSNRIYTRVDVGGGIQYFNLNTSHTITDINKIAIKWKNSDFCTFINGVKISSQLSGSTFSADTLNKLNLDNGSGVNNFFGKVKQLQVFKTALTDSELATLTT